MRQEPTSLLEQSAVGLLAKIVRRDRLRGMALKAVEKQVYHQLIERNSDRFPVRCQEEKYHLLRNLLHAFDRAVGEGRISRAVQEAALHIFVERVLLGSSDRLTAFAKQYGFLPPGLLTISPTKECNLRCAGCYASSSSQEQVALAYDVVDRIVREQRELWGSHFTVISGGEPVLWRSQGKDIFDLVAAHPDTYFLMYTNGVLIDKDLASRMGRAGNVTPAVSVEGFEKETDARRGRGAHRRIVEALGHLRDAGVPFGVSITATRDNAELVVSDELMDFYFGEQGAIYGWIFQYMPIGRHFTIDRMVTPAQRLRMYKETQRQVRERGIFLVDFWNSGPASSGCIAGGRSGGYFYIDWNGSISPCVFFPYTLDNIHDVYERGGDLNTVLMSPYFEAIRRWQYEYGYGKPPREVCNEIVPCPIRDHHLEAMAFVHQFGAQPMDEAAAQALRDEEYHSRLAAYGRKFDELTKGIWEEKYVGPEKREATQVPASVKA